MQHQTELNELSSPETNLHPPENAHLPPHIERHTRKCAICRHPERDEMEQEYTDWFSVAGIARRYAVDDSSLQRHLKAVGLAGSRRENLRIVLDRILERGVQTPVTASHIIRAVKAHACLTDDNRWVEPERKIIYIRADTERQAASER